MKPSFVKQSLQTPSLFSEKKQGFTLIELIIVIVIISIFTTLALSTVNRFTNEKQLQNETKKVMTILELTKSKTNSGDRTRCGPDDLGAFEIQDFTFKVNDSGLSYQIIPNCKSGEPTPILYSVANGIQLNPDPYERPFTTTFSAIYGKVKCSCFIVKSIILSKCNYIQVSENAVIDEGNCTDCDTCINSSNCDCL